MDKVRSELISNVIKIGIESETPTVDIKRNLITYLDLYDKHNQTTQPVTLEQYIKHLLKQYDKEPSYSLEDNIDNAKDYLNLHQNTP